MDATKIPGFQRLVGGSKISMERRIHSSNQRLLSNLKCQRYPTGGEPDASRGQEGDSLLSTITAAAGMGRRYGCRRWSGARADGPVITANSLPGISMLPQNRLSVTTSGFRYR